MNQLLRAFRASFHSRSDGARIAVLAFAALVGLTAPTQAGLKIIRNPTNGIGGTPPPNLAGGGNLIEIFNQAADYWEMAFPDPNQDWNLELEFRWDPLGGNDGTLSAQFTARTFGGEPRRIQSGLITFLNNGAAHFFADPHPATNSAYSLVKLDGAFAIFPSSPSEDVFLNVGISFKNPINPDAIDHFDLLTTAMHEIGHGLGLAAAPPDWVLPNDIIISSAVSTRYDGALINYQLGAQEHLDYPSVMHGYFYSDERRLPSVRDILAIAQVSHYDRPFLSPYMEVIISGLELPPGLKNALQTKLQKSRAHLAAGNRNAAKNLLNAFIDQVNDNPGGRLDQDQLDNLVSMAELRIDSIDNPPPGEQNDIHSTPLGEQKVNDNTAPGKQNDALNTPPLPGIAACGTVSAGLLPLSLIGFAHMRGDMRTRRQRGRSEVESG
jgi:hypothetical protein